MFIFSEPHSKCQSPRSSLTRLPWHGFELKRSLMPISATELIHGALVIIR
jgi:hypothetical protein